MIKKMINIVKKIVFTCLILYGYNIVMSSLNIAIPINIITVLIISILGLPSLLALILIQILIF